MPRQSQLVWGRAWGNLSLRLAETSGCLIDWNCKDKIHPKPCLGSPLRTCFVTFSKCWPRFRLQTSKCLCPSAVQFCTSYCFWLIGRLENGTRMAWEPTLSQTKHVYFDDVYGWMAVALPKSSEAMQCVAQDLCGRFQTLKQSELETKFTNGFNNFIKQFGLCFLHLHPLVHRLYYWWKGICFVSGKVPLLVCSCALFWPGGTSKERQARKTAAWWMAMGGDFSAIWRATCIYMMLSFPVSCFFKLMSPKITFVTTWFALMIYIGSVSHFVSQVPTLSRTWFPNLEPSHTIYVPPITLFRTLSFCCSNLFFSLFHLLCFIKICRNILSCSMLPLTLSPFCVSMWDLATRSWWFSV